MGKIILLSLAAFFILMVPVLFPSMEPEFFQSGYTFVYLALVFSSFVLSIVFGVLYLILQKEILLKLSVFPVFFFSAQIAVFIIFLKEFLTYYK